MEIENKPLMTANEFLDFMDTNDMLMHLTIKEAKKLLHYMEEHGYMFEDCNGTLMRLNLDSDRENPVREEYSVDDAIDAACEWNYELIQETKEAMEHPENFLEFIKRNQQYKSLREDEEILDQMFDRTKYGKEIMELADKLANKFIQKAKKQEDVGEAIKSMMDGVAEYSTEKKERAR